LIEAVFSEDNLRPYVEINRCNSLGCSFLFSPYCWKRGPLFPSLTVPVSKWDSFLLTACSLCVTHDCNVCDKYVRSKLFTFWFAFLLLLAYFAFLINVLLSYNIHKSFYSHIHLVEFVEIVLTQSIHRSSVSYNYYLEVWKPQTFQIYWLPLIFA
jgi:hypothetical protein